MQRVIQMNVIPDLIPRIDPTIDLAVSFGESPATTGGEAGAFLLPSQVCRLWHEDDQLFIVAEPFIFGMYFRLHKHRV